MIAFDHNLNSYGNPSGNIQLLTTTKLRLVFSLLDW